MSAEDALKEIASESEAILTLFEGDRFIGMISTSELKRYASEEMKSLQAPSHNHRFPHVHSDHTLDVALQRMGTSGLKMLPVVSRSDIHRLEGVIAIEDVMKAYGRSSSPSWTSRPISRGLLPDTPLPIYLSID